MRFRVSLSFFLLLAGCQKTRPFSPLRPRPSLSARQTPSNLGKLVSADVSSQLNLAKRSSAADIEEAPSLISDEEEVRRHSMKVNEIDFCIAPADASLSRSVSSLTRFLNNASNRAVRRILLARSWPSAEALNLSFRQILSAPQEQSSSKCPVPRPILNILMRRRDTGPSPRSRSDEEYVSDQISNFRDKYSQTPGWELAEAYLDCVLSLATSGVESERVQEVIDAGAYDESYVRMVSVLERVGVVWEEMEDGRRKIARKLADQDICLSVLDKIRLRQEVNGIETPAEDGTSQEPTETLAAYSSNKPIRLKFWRKNEETNEEEDDQVELSNEDLGGVLLSADEPSITRQLNALSNIVQRALLFGGDQELLVLSETLEADKPAFIQRWYPSDLGESAIEMPSPQEELRPGVQYLNCLVGLLRDCYENRYAGLEPPLPLVPSYFNAYERLTAALVELGSGYIRPSAKSMPIPRTAQEELGRFAVWETNFRSTAERRDTFTYPEDLVGEWRVQDEVGGKIIGMSTIVLAPKGQVQVDAPSLRGLRWRLDPGPTHLDTCTFQVLSDEDGTVLQYRGFLDRGARLEARFSKRPITIRGSVMFQMRDESDTYWRQDMLPINYRTGTTKFVMTKVVT